MYPSKRTFLAISNSILTSIILSSFCCGQQSSQTDNVGQLASSTVATTNQQQQLFLSDNIDVTINASPVKVVAGTNFVAAKMPIQIQAKFDSTVNDSTLEYEWSTKEGGIKENKNASSIVYQFTKSDEDNFILLNVKDPKTNATGTAKLDVSVRSRLVVGDPVGKTFIEKGELLEISLVYSGSPPFTYCYKFCSDYDILPCTLCFPSSETTNTTIPIVHYLHYVGNYTLFFRIENIMNYEERQYVIKINDTVRPKSNLPIAPIVSSMLAVFIIITGVALHMRFKDTSYTTETANFDFFHDDNDEEWEQELSLIQRIRYLFSGSEQEEERETRHLLQKGPSNTIPNYSNDRQSPQQQESRSDQQ